MICCTDGFADLQERKFKNTSMRHFTSYTVTSRLLVRGSSRQRIGAPLLPAEGIRGQDTDAVRGVLRRKFCVATTAPSTFDQAVLETQVVLALCSAWLPAHLAAVFMFVWLNSTTVMSAVRIVVVTLSSFTLGRPWLSWDALSA